MPPPKIALLASVILLVLSACAPTQMAAGERANPPALTQEFLTTGDGQGLAVKQWPSNTPRAIILALHGYNDYSHAFELFGRAMQAHNFHVIAYDHRGFGQNPKPGIWPGTHNLVNDARDAITAVHAQYPNRPIYLLGSSMGGAIAISTMHTHPTLPIRGLILAAPAIWGGESMSQFNKSILWAMAHTIPTKTFTGEELKIQATDNIELLKEMVQDPYIIKASRVDSIYGLVRLMDDAYQHKHIATQIPTMLLYGLNDEVVPPTPMYRLAKSLPEPSTHLYDHGYHMLLRDTQRGAVFKDIIHWINTHESN